jgi:hypothetical protein
VRETVAVLLEEKELFPCFLVLGTEYAKARLPLVLPPACGAVKVAVRLAPWPGASVNGMLSPLLLNPVPDTVAWEIVRFELPLLLRATDFDTLLPIGTLPKFTVEGLTASCAAAVVANRNTFNRTNPQPAHVHGELRRFTLFLLLRALCQHGGGLWSSLHRVLRPCRSRAGAVYELLFGLYPDLGQISKGHAQAVRLRTGDFQPDRNLRVNIV